MRVSELAKELGYRAVELVELAKTKGIQLENIRANVDARTAMAIRAHVPHRSKLDGALLQLYQKVQADASLYEAARVEAGTAKRTRVTSGETKTKRTRRKVIGETPAPAAESPAATPVEAPLESAPVAPPAQEEPAVTEEVAASKAPPKKVKVVEEFHLGATSVRKPDKLKPKIHAVPVEVPKEVKLTPLIDVDKVIGVEKEVHSLRPQEVERFSSDRPPVEDKERRQAQKTLKAQTPGPATSVRFRKPRIPPPSLRPTVQPPKPRPVVPPPSERKLEVTVPISIKDFSQITGVKVNALIRKLIDQGVIATINHVMDQTMVEMMALEFNRDITVVQQRRIEETVRREAEEKDDPKELVPRAPVVAFLGHVDHGKTSLLDRIRNTDVVAGESGGITQHIGASKIVTKDERPVVLLDTPGHEAFTAMRARGAHVTDVVVLVVAADDGVMPQTEEAFNHAQAAGVKIVVALNKMDKPGANPNKVKGQLAALGLNPEDWGGDTVVAEVSAITGQGIEHLVEMLSLEAELLELKANPKRPATGAVLEARKTEGRGVVATLLVQNGTLRRGDVILAGPAHGRVRAMQDAHGKGVGEAGPSTPVEMIGLVDLPDAGDRFMVVRDIRTAKTISEERQAKARQAQLQERQHLTLENLFSKIETDKLREVRVVLRADVQGSLEVLKDSLVGLSTEEVKLKLLHASVGSISEGDIILADASDAIVIGFHVDVEERAHEVAKERGVEIRLYQVIYQAMEEMKAALEGLLEPEVVEVRQGRATVKEVFRISRVGAVAGCIVSDGKIERSNRVKLTRDGQVIFEGSLESLKRFKDDVREVGAGYECGLKLAGHDNIKPGDILEAYATQKIARKLEKK